MAARSEVPRRVIALVVLALGFAVSCARMLGEVQIEGRETRVGGLSGPDAGPPPKEVICELGTTNCDGRLLQLCTDGGTAWVTWQACATPALCKSELSTVAACITPTCALEQMSCSGAELRLCNEDRTGWTVFDTCETAAHCDAGKRQCLPAPCAPGDRRCNVGELQKCQDDQLDWEKLELCATNEVCEFTLAGKRPGLMSGVLMGNETLPPVVPLAGNSEPPIRCFSPACLNLEMKCDGARLLACNEGLTDFDKVEDCATPVLCDASIAYSGIRGSPRCKRPACDVGKHHCSDTGVLEICNEDRTGFKAIEECIGPPFCSAVAADNNEPGCRDAPCESGEEQCNNADIQRCSVDRTQFNTIATCETRGLCNDDNSRDAVCDPPVCQRGPLSGTEFRCQGAVLQRCNDQHTGYDTLNTCATAGLCSSGLGFNGCIAPTCAPGQTRCSGDFLQVCNSQRNGFDNLERCSGGTCDSNAGRCSDPCVVGTARCNNQGQLEECRDRLVGRQVTARCASPQLCDFVARSCRQPPAGCTADGVHVCARQGANTLLQVCSEGRSRLATVDTCTGGEICDPNNAAPNQDVCDACAQNSQPTCQGNDLVSCSADGITTSRLNCPNGCQVVENAPDRCRNCVLGSATCDATGLLVCVSGGATNEFRERRACTTPGACQATLLACNFGRDGQNCSCAPGVCTAGQRNCRGNQPVTCANDLLSFVNDGPSCGTRVCFPRPGSAEHPAGSCGCRPGEDVQCVGGILQTCTPTGTFEPDPRFIRGGVLCLPGPNGTGQRALSCNGNSLRDDTCSFGCTVEKGCAECDASFKPICDGPSSRTVCNGGDLLEGQSCVSTTSNACLETVCQAGACNPNAPREDGTPCGNGALCENGVCARCGDGVINGSEVCDNNAVRACPNGQIGSIQCIGCQEVSDCRAPRCGDGICTRTANESAVTCPADCPSVCGDGSVTGGEQCEGDQTQPCPPGQLGIRTCTRCQFVAACVPSLCGDDVCTPAANETGANCPADCPSVCGDRVVNGAEECEGSTTRPCTAPQIGTQQCTGCKFVGTCANPRCGDGTCTVAANETSVSCPADCESICGDGAITRAEQCEGDGRPDCPAPQIGRQQCMSCQLVGACANPFCGDGTCTAAANETTATCPADCGSFCGDRAVNGPDEECEGTTTRSCAPQIGTQTCQNCKFVGACTDGPRCGDGSVNSSTEECDGTAGLGTCGAGQFGPVTCNANCTRNTSGCRPLCGNGQTDPGNGEQCDGNSRPCENRQLGTITCNPNCTENTSACRDRTCADVDCPSNQVCNPQTVACRDRTCADVDCPSNQVCNPQTVACRDRTCADVNCQSGQVCNEQTLNCDAVEAPAPAQPPPSEDDGNSGGAP